MTIKKQGFDSTKLADLDSLGIFYRLNSNADSNGRILN